MDLSLATIGTTWRAKAGASKGELYEVFEIAWDGTLGLKNKRSNRKHWVSQTGLLKKYDPVFPSAPIPLSRDEQIRAGERAQTLADALVWLKEAVDAHSYDEVFDINSMKVIVGGFEDAVALGLIQRQQPVTEPGTELGTAGFLLDDGFEPEEGS